LKAPLNIGLDMKGKLRTSEEEENIVRNRFQAEENVREQCVKLVPNSGIDFCVQKKTSVQQKDCEL
jgi:hypothetical protein